MNAPAAFQRGINGYQKRFLPKPHRLAGAYTGHRHKKGPHRQEIRAALSMKKAAEVSCSAALEFTLFYFMSDGVHHGATDISNTRNNIVSV
ncbi:hypothetical protein [Desulfosarcina alkanivorans]|uniref:hypothetical protein n=1 Tax=Desulfosarcina alkanivorans TaxID=571177 RepID=UPI0012D2B793|nr:hypothetical protein [Desulfosarcina alkanivorans]